jgi:hypothetical protein
MSVAPEVLRRSARQRCRDASAGAREPKAGHGTSFTLEERRHAHLGAPPLGGRRTRRIRSPGRARPRARRPRRCDPAWWSPGTGPARPPRPVALAEEIRCAAVADVAPAELRLAGGRAPRGGLTPVERLTPGERRVAELAAAGQQPADRDRQLPARHTTGRPRRWSFGCRTPGLLGLNPVGRAGSTILRAARAPTPGSWTGCDQWTYSERGRHAGRGCAAEPSCGGSRRSLASVLSPSLPRDERSTTATNRRRDERRRLGEGYRDQQRSVVI